jgi:flagellar motility protein MotE (MotC chaperone)
MRFRPTLLQLTAFTALAASVGLGNAIANQPLETSRLGASIKENLADRDRAAAEQKRKLDLQKQVMQAAEGRLRAQLGANRPQAGGTPGAAGGAPGGVGGLPGQPSQPALPDEAISNLARIYQAMKPAKAAVVMEKLGIDVQVKITKEIRERPMGMIMGAMSPDGAARLSAALANNGRLPAGFGQAPGAAMPRSTASASGQPSAKPANSNASAKPVTR